MPPMGTLKASGSTYRKAADAGAEFGRWLAEQLSGRRGATGRW